MQVEVFRKEFTSSLAARNVVLGAERCCICVGGVQESGCGIGL